MLVLPRLWLCEHCYNERSSNVKRRWVSLICTLYHIKIDLFLLQKVYFYCALNKDITTVFLLQIFTDIDLDCVFSILHCVVYVWSVFSSMNKVVVRIDPAKPTILFYRPKCLLFAKNNLSVLLYLCIIKLRLIFKLVFINLRTGSRIQSFYKTKKNKNSKNLK